jgi:hypothetical protein
MNGSLSAINSPAASAAKLFRAAVDPRNRKRDFVRSISPDRADALTIAGAVIDRNPATIPSVAAEANAGKFCDMDAI